MNHVLKILTDWKQKNLLDLVNVIYEHVRVHAQYKDIERAIVGRGNYMLSEDYKHYSMKPEVWCTKSKEERKKLLDKLLNNVNKRQGNVITSTDKTLTVTFNPSAGRKPGQVKRKRSAKTSTWNQPKME